ncbi:MAG: Fic family protein [Ignavibacteriae bacterium]|nr:Fic family protein [Ignavibacteriota bacterium]
MKLSDAAHLVGKLHGIAGDLPNPHLLIGPFVRREAVLSSRIEGTQASLSDLVFFEASGESSAEVSDVREVANYVHALEFGLKRLDKLPLSLRLMKEMHSRLMKGVRGETLTPGEFRRSQNWIGPPGCTLTDAVYVPPPVDEMKQSLDAFEKYLHASSNLPPLIRLALIHYQFEAIHPFLDGNGRVGRLLMTLILCSEGLLPQPLLYLSAYFERHRAEYYRHLLAVSQTGAWNAWIEFFLTGVAEQSQDAIQRTQKLLGLWKRYRERLRAVRSSPTMLELVEHLFSSPAISVSQAASRLKVTYPSAQKAIERLVEMNILKEATGRLRNKVYVAREILRVAEAESVT